MSQKNDFGHGVEGRGGQVYRLGRVSEQLIVVSWSHLSSVLRHPGPSVSRNHSPLLLSSPTCLLLCEN